MKNFEIARLFDLMADLLEIKGDNPFRIRAYRRAGQNVESLGEDIEAVARARRAWIGPSQVINTWPLKKLLAWARSGRPARGRESRAGRST